MRQQTIFGTEDPPKTTTEMCDRMRQHRTKFPEYSMWDQAKRRSFRKGIDFTITIEDVVIPDVCPLLGLRLAIDVSSGVQGPKNCSPTLDRIDNTKGYVPGNVRAISWRANLLKRDATLQELEFLVENLRRAGG